MTLQRVVMLLALPSGVLAAQDTRDPHAVQPERPTVATHAHTVAPGWLEFEFGGEYDRYDDATHGVLTPLTTKLGLTSHAQLTIQTPGNAPPGGTLGLGDVSLGVKWRLLDDSPVLGDFAILPAIKLATGSLGTGCRAVIPSTCTPTPPRGSGTTDVSLTVISSHALGAVSMDINLGYTRQGVNGLATSRDQTLWTISFGGPAVAAFGWTVEMFGYPPPSGPASPDNIVALLGGPTFSLTPWLAADAGGIVPLTGPQPKAIYAGMVVNVGHVFH